MQLDKHAVERAHYILDTHRESRRLYDAGDKKKVHWRILEKELPMAEEIIRLKDMPTPKPQIEYRDRDRIITKKEWWPGIAIGVFLSIMTYGVYSWVKFYVQ